MNFVELLDTSILEDEDTTLTFPTVTRVTVVDGECTRVFEKWRLKEVQLSIQDDGRTLKVFVK